MLAACVERAPPPVEHVRAYSEGTIPADQIAVIESGDNFATTPSSSCAYRFWASAKQVDGTELGNTKSIDLAPGSHEVVVGFYEDSTYLRFLQRFTVNVQARHTYKVHVRWIPSCPSWAEYWIRPGVQEKLETWIYDVASGEIVSKSVGGHEPPTPPLLPFLQTGT